jgi:hypothetical protein
MFPLLIGSRLRDLLVSLEHIHHGVLKEQDGEIYGKEAWPIGVFRELPLQGR